MNITETKLTIKNIYQDYLDDGANIFSFVRKQVSK